MNVPNPEYKSAPITMVFMNRDGCYHFDGNTWFQFQGYDKYGTPIWAKIEEYDVPESFLNQHERK